MLVGIVRTIIMYIIIVLILRIMGKRQIGQLQPFELVIILIISELATIPSQNIGIPLITGLIPTLVLLLIGVTITQITLKSEKARALICGTPTILIDKGIIVESEMKKIRYNLSDLMEQLRSKDIFNIADVEYAILETNGQLSVIPKSLKRAVCPEDLNLQPKYEGLPTTLIMDGVIQYKNMSKTNTTQKKLDREIRKAGLKTSKDILIAIIDSDENIFFQGKEKKK
ncbi:MAG: DUF421 domain-containing protein [Eubacteriales bacterium]